MLIICFQTYSNIYIYRIVCIYAIRKFLYANYIFIMYIFICIHIYIYNTHIYLYFSKYVLDFKARN